MAPAFDAKVQRFYKDNGLVQLALCSPSIHLNGKLLVARSIQSLEMDVDNTAIGQWFEEASSKLGQADQDSLQLYKPNLYTGFLHCTLGKQAQKKRMLPGGDLRSIQEKLRNCPDMDSLLSTPIKCKPGKLFYAQGDSKQDRDKIIVDLGFDEETLQRIKQIASRIEAAWGEGFNLKTDNPHMIVAKDYDAKWGTSPEPGLLYRLEVELRALNPTITFGRLAVSAAGSDLGYVVAPSDGVLTKYPVKQWPVGDRSLEKSVLWVPGDSKAAELAEAIIKSQDYSTSKFLQDLMAACSGAYLGSNEAFMKLAKICSVQDLDEHLPTAVLRTPFDGATHGRAFQERQKRHQGQCWSHGKMGEPRPESGRRSGEVEQERW